MSYSIYTIPPFDRQAKRLAKKYPSFKSDFSEFLKSLKEKPEQGAALGNNCFKIRFAITSKGRGKAGGARVITHYKVIQSAVYLLSIYDKSEKEDIPDKYISDLLKYIP
jgi:mRNA-degrading endonuclease RelE of RelBE toxin-antitoxin system